jgi:hypothetical protein
LAERLRAVPPPQRWNTSVRNSMLSRGGASGGEVGSRKAVCGAKRALLKASNAEGVLEYREGGRFIEWRPPAASRLCVC